MNNNNKRLIFNERHDDDSTDSDDEVFVNNIFNEDVEDDEEALDELMVEMEQLEVHTHNHGVRKQLTNYNRCSSRQQPNQSPKNLCSLPQR